MLKDYANQTLEWKIKQSADKYNSPSFSATTLRGRKEGGFRLVRNSQGEEVVSSGYVMTESAVSPGDMVDGRYVISSEPARGLNGNVLYYEVYLQ